jgi:hypothetical protein
VETVSDGGTIAELKSPYMNWTVDHEWVVASVVCLQAKPNVAET